MEKTLDKQIAIVTGASRGIGRAIAIELARQGATVIGTATSESGANAITEAFKAEGLNGRGAVLNVNDAAAAEALIDGTVKEFGVLNVLVNNAGITQDQLAMRMKDDDWDAVIDTNLSAGFRLTRRALRGMVRSRFGRIVNIASVVGPRANAGQANYAASKAGLIGLTRTVAAEVARKNVTVNAVAPGFIETDMTADVPDAIKESVPARRAGTPDEVAACVRFLASDAAGYVTGTTLYVDGGLAA
jgi:3-oxoacyl-[acyl-carrier protein] reductase